MYVNGLHTVYHIHKYTRVQPTGQHLNKLTQTDDNYLTFYLFIYVGHIVHESALHCGGVVGGRLALDCSGSILKREHYTSESIK